MKSIIHQITIIMDPNRPLSEIMTTSLICVKPNDPAEDVRTIFRDNPFHHIPVTDLHGNLLGIISKADFLRISYVLSLETTGKTYSGKIYHHLLAKDFMTAFPLTLNPDDSVGLAADIILANKFHALPVIEDGQLVGLVTTHDLLAYSFRSPIESTLS